MAVTEFANQFARFLSRELDGKLGPVLEMVPESEGTRRTDFDVGPTQTNYTGLSALSCSFFGDRGYYLDQSSSPNAGFLFFRSKWGQHDKYVVFSYDHVRFPLRTSLFEMNDSAQSSS